MSLKECFPSIPPHLIPWIDASRLSSGVVDELVQIPKVILRTFQKDFRIFGEGLMLLLVISISHKVTTFSSLTRGLIREEGEERKWEGNFFSGNSIIFTHVVKF